MQQTLKILWLLRDGCINKPQISSWPMLEQRNEKQLLAHITYFMPSRRFLFLLFLFLVYISDYYIICLVKLQKKSKVEYIIHRFMSCGYMNMKMPTCKGSFKSLLDQTCIESNCPLRWWKQNLIPKTWFFAFSDESKNIRNPKARLLKCSSVVCQSYIPVRQGCLKGPLIT